MNEFTQKIKVTKDHLDELDHVNNVQYLYWAQEIAKSPNKAQAYNFGPKSGSTASVKDVIEIAKDNRRVPLFLLTQTSSKPTWKVD